MEIFFNCQSEMCRGWRRVYHMRVVGGGNLVGKCGTCQSEVQWIRVATP